jgi:hypothetical protein
VQYDEPTSKFPSLCNDCYSIIHRSDVSFVSLHFVSFSNFQRYFLFVKDDDKDDDDAGTQAWASDAVAVSDRKHSRERLLGDHASLLIGTYVIMALS